MATPSSPSKNLTSESWQLAAPPLLEPPVLLGDRAIQDPLVAKVSLPPKPFEQTPSTLSQPPVSRSLGWWIRLPGRILYGLFQFASLTVLLAVVSAIPLLQLASLGYLLEVSRRIAANVPGRRILPGLDRASRIGVMLTGATLTWLPVWLVSDYAYSAELIESGGRLSRNWHTAAWMVSVLWVIHVAWAALRGGRWYHFLWPAPLRFVRQIWQKDTWRRAEDSLWNYTVGLRIPVLMWLGFRGFLGGLIWLFVPASLMIIGIRADGEPGRVILGIIGAFLMTWIILYLPFLQVQMAREDRFRAIFDLRSVRADFKRAPWAFALSFFVTLAVSIPLYIFRIESLPRELLWVPCLFFILMALPSRMLVGWAMRRGHRDIPRRWWPSRWVAWLFQLAGIPVYVLFLYLATITSWDGVLIFLIQHAFLLPVPLNGT